MSYGNYPDLSQVKKILVVKLRHHGDVLLTSPVFTNLKKAIPEAQIDAYVYKDTLPMLEGHPAIANYHLQDRGWKKLPFLKRILQELRLLRQIRKQRYDCVINLTEGDRGAIAAMVSGSTYKIGFDPGDKGFIGKKKSYTHLVKHCSKPRHTVEKQLDVVRRMGIFPSPEERELTFHLPEEVRKKVRTLLQENGLIEGEYIVIHPVSRWRFKCPPPSYIARLIKALQKEGKKIVLTSGPDSEEMKMIQQISELVSDLPIVNLAGKTTLKELGALLQFSFCLICVDSVPLHMASALKVPVAVLFGPTSEENWGPWNHPKSRVIAKKTACRPCFLDGCGGSKMSDCLYTLPIQDILEAVSSFKH
jgi:heptosyltransferase-3